jgi:hypothetical protein
MAGNRRITNKDEIMKKIVRIIIGVIIISCGIGIATLSFHLLTPKINWGLLIPTDLFALVVMVVGVQVASGESWREIMDFLIGTLNWF